MAEEIPRWAIERALAELGSLSPYATVSEVLHYAAEPICNRYARQVLAFARYIAEHEEPPVDPLLIEAREIAAGYCTENGCNESAEMLRAGRADHWAYANVALAALRRGMELAREQSK